MKSLFLSILMSCAAAFVCFGSASEEADRKIEFTYELEKSGYVSIGIFDPQDRQIRVLSLGQKQYPGEHTVAWDGLDRHGNRQMPGSYTWKLLKTPGFTAKHLLDLPSPEETSRTTSDGVQEKKNLWNIFPHDHGQRVLDDPIEDIMAKVPTGSYITMDPRAPEKAFYFSKHPDKTHRVKLDLDLQEWELKETYQAPDTGGLFPSFEARLALWEIQERDGAEFLVSSGGRFRQGAPAVYRIDRETRQLVPMATAGIISTENIDDTEDLPEPLRQALAGKSISNENEGFWGYAWSDKNANGVIEPDEFILTPVNFIISSRYAAIDDEWNVYFSAAKVESEEKQTETGKLPAWHVLPNKDKTAGAPPFWDWSLTRESSATLPEEVYTLGNFSKKTLFRTIDGQMHTFLTGHQGIDDDRQGTAWPATLYGSVRLYRWSPEQELSWEIGNHGADKELSPGRFLAPGRVLAEVRDCIVVEDRAVLPPTVWDSNGLYAGSLTADETKIDVFIEDFPMEDDNRISDSQYLEQINGQLWELPGGRVLWQPASQNGVSLYWLEGWDDWSRQSGTIEVKAEPRVAVAQGRGLFAKYYQQKFWQGDPFYQVIDHNIWFGTRYLPGTQMPSPREWHPDRLLSDSFSVRWSGWVEPKFSEEYRFIIEADQNASVRIWMADEVVLEDWVLRQRPEYPDEVRTKRLFTAFLPMQAGGRYNIIIEYSTLGGRHPHMHLNWESRISQERQHIPQAYLYTDYELRDEGIILRPRLPPEPMRTPVDIPSPW